MERRKTAAWSNNRQTQKNCSVRLKRTLSKLKQTKSMRLMRMISIFSVFWSVSAVPATQALTYTTGRPALKGSRSWKRLSVFASVSFIWADYLTLHVDVGREEVLSIDLSRLRTDVRRGRDNSN